MEVILYHHTQHITKAEENSLTGPLKLFPWSEVEKHLPVGVFQNENLK